MPGKSGAFIYQACGPHCSIPAHTYPINVVFKVGLIKALDVAVQGN